MSWTSSRRWRGTRAGTELPESESRTPRSPVPPIRPMKPSLPGVGMGLGRTPREEEGHANSHRRPVRPWPGRCSQAPIQGVDQICQELSGDPARSVRVQSHIRIDSLPPSCWPDGRSGPLPGPPRQWIRRWSGRTGRSWWPPPAGARVPRSGPPGVGGGEETQAQPQEEHGHHDRAPSRSRVGGSQEEAPENARNAPARMKGRYPLLARNHPEVVLAMGQPMDMGARVIPASMAVPPRTPWVNMGTKAAAQKRTVPMRNPPALATAMTRFWKSSRGSMGSGARLSCHRKKRRPAAGAEHHAQGPGIAPAPELCSLQEGQEEKGDGGGEAERAQEVQLPLAPVVFLFLQEEVEHEDGERNRRGGSGRTPSARKGGR